MIGVSLLKDDDIYFRISPAVAHIVTGIIVFIFVYIMKQSILVDMMEKYQLFELCDRAMELLNKPDMSFFIRLIFEELGKHLPFWLLFHGILVWIVAVKCNKWWWLASYLGGFFIISIVGLLFIIVQVLRDVQI